MKTIYEVTCLLHKGTIHFDQTEWRIIREIVKYVDLRNEEGKNRRIQTASINTIIITSKCFKDGMLSASTFCSEANCNRIQQQMVAILREEIMKYQSDLNENLRAVDQFLFVMKN